MTGTKLARARLPPGGGGRLPVRLLWNQRSHNLALEVDDRGVERVLALPDPSVARNAFHAPVRTYAVTG